MVVEKTYDEKLVEILTKFDERIKLLESKTYEQEDIPEEEVKAEQEDIPEEDKKEEQEEIPEEDKKDETVKEETEEDNTQKESEEIEEETSEEPQKKEAEEDEETEEKPKPPILEKLKLSDIKIKSTFIKSESFTKLVNNILKR
jgi:hypothetical protein